MCVCVCVCNRAAVTNMWGAGWVKTQIPLYQPVTNEIWRLVKFGRSISIWTGAAFYSYNFNIQSQKLKSKKEIQKKIVSISLLFSYFY